MPHNILDEALNDAENYDGDYDAESINTEKVTSVPDANSFSGGLLFLVSFCYIRSFRFLCLLFSEYYISLKYVKITLF